MCSQVSLPETMVILNIATVPSATLLAMLKAKALLRTMLAPAPMLAMVSLLSVMVMPAVLQVRVAVTLEAD